MESKPFDGLRHLTIRAPPYGPERSTVRLFQDLHLADPNFATPESIDIVLGANVYPHILLPGFVHRRHFLAQKTVFGWVITRHEKVLNQNAITMTCSSSVRSLSDSWHEVLMGLIQRFWNIEEVPRALWQSPDDAVCEALYVARHRRDASGRHSDPLPIVTEDLPFLGESLTNAWRALSSVHQRMLRDSRLRDELNT